MKHGITKSAMLPCHVFPLLLSHSVRETSWHKIYEEKTQVIKVDDLPTCAWACNILLAGLEFLVLFLSCSHVVNDGQQKIIVALTWKSLSGNAGKNEIAFRVLGFWLQLKTESRQLHRNCVCARVCVHECTHTWMGTRSHREFTKCTVE